ncbi:MULTISPECIES: HEPN/Toprim-associated domain-containing protein [Agrobacterium]|uniref:HEPN/Toprim-associated domain-containing protein n=1 Tax=Agrobacterium TaxID=357 RepID=UPI000DD8B070|nr:HEPN/Toprim-associated domain-containing protein [Agrobacterium sp. SORGH_AS_0745]MDP9762482.1 hypothetical protein [Agrobacterium tumefaciens]MDQ1220397.1 hypothetical protein [Agrobacterium sp. SORGH_AS_0745]
MGSMIHLTLGRIQLDWGKNAGFCDHGPLFRPNDLAEIPYYYAADADDKECQHLPLISRSSGFSYRLVTEMKEGFSAPLRVVAERLELLGYTEKYCRREFEELTSMVPSNHDFSFDELKVLLLDADFTQAALGPHLPSENLAEFLAVTALRHIPETVQRLQHESDLHDGEVSGLGAYTVIRLLADNPTARDLPVTWQFSDVLEGGWVSRDVILTPVAQGRRFLLVTEGSSDVQVIKHALHLLRPDLSDFFDFVDMHDNYPFSGTGNLYNFVRGLISIRIQNNILVLFDNDAEGVFNFERSSRLNTLPNMRIMKLPDRQNFVRFRTLGPTGEQIANINGKAAAIECYLDVSRAPVVRWTSYDQRRDCYQGHLVEKETFSKEFLSQKALVDGYDYSGLENVLDMLLRECISINEENRATALESGSF